MTSPYLQREHKLRLMSRALRALPDATLGLFTSREPLYRATGVSNADITALDDAALATERTRRRLFAASDSRKIA